MHPLAIFCACCGAIFLLEGFAMLDDLIVDWFRIYWWERPRALARSAMCAALLTCGFASLAMAYAYA